MEIICGKTAGFCYGVQRAVNGANEEVENGEKKLCCLGEIVHNKNVVESLEKKGFKFIDNIEQAIGKTIIRAHGIPKEVYEKAKNLNIEIKDLTCPSVLKIHKIAEEYSKKGYFIVVTGKETHPEVIGIVSYCGDKFMVVKQETEIETVVKRIKELNEQNVLLISQTTYSSKKFDEIAEILKKSISENVKLEIRKTICPSTEIRQKETEEISKQVDFMIIIGDKKSSNTNKLYDIANEYCGKVIFIDDEKELDLRLLKDVNKVGIMAGASTPKEDIKKVQDKIGGLCNGA